MASNVAKTVDDTAPPCCGTFAKSLHDTSIFAVTFELVPGRGALEKAQDQVLLTAERLAKCGKVHGLTITDNPGGTPSLAAEILSLEILRLGIEPIVHLTCKDKNRNQLESLLYGFEREHIRNLLVMSGDYPRSGYMGDPRPVFDLDPIALLGLIAELNRGKSISPSKGTTQLMPAHFFAGAVTSPFKALEAEQVPQYYKLKKKLAAGAQFIVSQLGFDVRKFHELLQVGKLLGFADIPILGNIYVLSAGAARLMHGHGLPGCVVTDKLLSQVEQEATASDKGKGARLERAAKMFALLKGMGFAGAHISGNNVSSDDVVWIIDRGHQLAHDWHDLVQEFEYPSAIGWYYFERDMETGLNTDVPSQRTQCLNADVSFRAMRTIHKVMFDPRGRLFKPMQELAKRVNGSKFEPAFTRIEYFLKGITNDCLQCGDCALADTAYLCPQSECAKNQRNGPCGGSCDGWCEKFPDEKRCFWVRVYERLRSEGEEDSIEVVIPPVDHRLYLTSSWINYYLGHDHSAPRAGIPTVERNGKGSA